MSRLIVYLLIFIGIGYVIYSINQKISSPPSRPATPTSANLSFPAGWKIVETTPNSQKIQKSGNYKTVPTVVYLKSPIAGDKAEPQSYVDSLIAGAKSTIPGLVYSQNQTTPSGAYYLRQLTGSYPLAKSVIKLAQSIYVKDNFVYTITASYQNSDISAEEIKAVFETVFATKIANN